MCICVTCVVAVRQVVCVLSNYYRLCECGCLCVGSEIVFGQFVFSKCVSTKV